MIDEVHMLTNTAFNAMLKTLEEPPDYLKFVLATTDPQKVPATVLSRCLQFNLRPMAPETILEHLGHVLGIEEVPSDTQALRLLARAARGSMRDALSLTDQAIAFGSGQLHEASVRLMLGSVDRSYVFGLLDALARADGKSVVEITEVLRLHGLSAASTLEEMTTVLQRMAVLQAVPTMMSQALDIAADSDSSADPEAGEIARLAQLLPADETQLLYSLCLHGRGELGLAPDEYAALTMVLLRLLAFKPAGTVAVPRAVTSAPENSDRSAAEPTKKPDPEPVQAQVATPYAAPDTTAPTTTALSATAPNAVTPAPRPVATPPWQAVPPSSALTPQVKLQKNSANEPPEIEFTSDVDQNVDSEGLGADDDAQRPTDSEQYFDESPAFQTPVIAAMPTVPKAPIRVRQMSEPAPLPALVATVFGEMWADLVGQLVRSDAITALAREIALQSELVSHEAPLEPLAEEGHSLWTVCVERQSLIQPSACEKLQTALQVLLAQPRLKLTVDVGSVGDTPARRNNAALQERQRLAVEIINQDPLVLELMRDWGAKLVPGSIKHQLQATAEPARGSAGLPI
jgi:DNA polymerase-3 subunit gamma/tau